MTTRGWLDRARFAEHAFGDGVRGLGLQIRQSLGAGMDSHQYKEKKPKNPTIREKFDTYRFADYKEKVIDLLMRMTTVSIRTVAIVTKTRVGATFPITERLALLNDSMWYHANRSYNCMKRPICAEQ